MRLFLIANTVFREEHREFLHSNQVSWRQTKDARTSQQLIEFAGRVCYMSFGEHQSSKDNSHYIRHLIERGHESVLEHSSYTILADHISRALSHQLVRHRAGFSYSQLSQQYHDESSAVFTPPENLRDWGVAEQHWRAATEGSRTAYKAIVESLRSSTYASHLAPKERLRAIRSIARSVLPNATATTLVITGNARAWRHLLEVRGAIVGDLEMREFCASLLDLLTPEAPDVFGDFEIIQDHLGRLVRRSSEPSGESNASSTD